MREHTIWEVKFLAMANAQETEMRPQEEEKQNCGEPSRAVTAAQAGPDAHCGSLTADCWLAISSLHNLQFESVTSLPE